MPWDLVLCIQAMVRMRVIVVTMDVAERNATEFIIYWVDTNGVDMGWKVHLASLFPNGYAR